MDTSLSQCGREEALVGANHLVPFENFSPQPAMRISGTGAEGQNMHLKHFKSNRRSIERFFSRSAFAAIQGGQRFEL